MAHIVDHRGKSASPENRSRYIEKEREKIKRAVRHYVDKTNIKDIADGKDMSIDVSNHELEYNEDDDAIQFDPETGVQRSIYINNDEFEVGWEKDIDQLQEGPGKEGSEDGSDDEVTFKFYLTAQEFMDLLFEELCLPFFIKKTLEETDSTTFHKAGFVSDGAPARLNVLRTYKNSLARTSAERADYENQLKDEEDEDKRFELEEKIDHIPLFRDVDLRFSNIVAEPTHQNKGVMFCLMDVSGSMGEDERRIAKQFFLILYIFLKKCYTSVDVVFILHADTAREVDEQEFFHSQESGGTVMSTALVVMEKIIKERYNLDVCNIYAAHLGDGGNWSRDNPIYIKKLEELLKIVQYFIYSDIKIPSNGFMYDAALGEKLEHMSEERENLSSILLESHKDIWSAFLKLFKRKGSVDYEDI